MKSLKKSSSEDEQFVNSDSVEIPLEISNDTDINSGENVKEYNSVIKKSKDKHKVGFNDAWRYNYPWLKIEKNNEKEVLFCTLCIKWHKESTILSNSPWIKSGYLTARLDKIREHAQESSFL